MIGNGFSDKPDYDYEIAVYVEHVLGVMDHFGMRRAHFIGMSLGAWVASTIAVEPSRAGREGDPDVTGRAGRRRLEHGPDPCRTDEGRQRTDVGVDPRGVRALIADEANRLPDLIGLRQAIYQRDDTRETIDHLLILQDAAARDRNLIPEEKWRAIAAPVMIVASGKDHGVYQETATSIAGLIPNAEVFEMPEVRHWPHFEDPETFNPAAVSFLAVGLCR